MLKMLKTQECFISFNMYEPDRVCSVIAPQNEKKCSLKESEEGPDPLLPLMNGGPGVTHLGATESLWNEKLYQEISMVFSHLNIL